VIEEEKSWSLAALGMTLFFFACLCVEEPKTPHATAACGVPGGDFSAGNPREQQVPHFVLDDNFLVIGSGDGTQEAGMKASATSERAPGLARSHDLSCPTKRKKLRN
jgi:hypothetical protein